MISRKIWLTWQRMSEIFTLWKYLKNNFCIFFSGSGGSTCEIQNQIGWSSEITEKMSISYQPSEIQVSVFHSVQISEFFLIFDFCRLKAIQKHMKDVHPDSDTETEELKDLNKDILRRYEQLKQVWHSQCGIFRNFLPLRFSVKSISGYQWFQKLPF